MHVKLRCIHLLIPIILCCACLSPALGLIGGQPTQDHPFFVMIPKGDEICGGTLIALDIVLTAAQCLYYEKKQLWANPIEVYVLHGDFSVPGNWSAKYYQAENYVAHGSFDPSIMKVGSPFDIAVIKLEDRVSQTDSKQSSVLSICYNERKRYHRLGTVIGLGLTSRNPDTRASQLMEAVLKNDDTCGGILEGNLMKQYQICSYDKKTKQKYISKGDTGGPLVYRKKRNGEVVCVFGISSFSIYASKYGEYLSIFTFASKLEDWIFSQILYLSPGTEGVAERY